MVRFIDIIRGNNGPHDDDARPREPVAPVERTHTVYETAEKRTSVEHSRVYHDVLKAVRAVIMKTHEKRVINEEDVFPIVTIVVDAFIRDPYSELLLSSYTASKDDYLVAHIANVLILTVGFGRSLGYPRTDLLKIGACALCHDLGMVEHSGLVNKKKGLSTAERKKVQAHPLRSAELAKTAVTEDLLSIIKEIHERENGEGVPEGLKTDEITAWSKVIALCDVYEALTHPRIHRPFYNPHQALRKIIEMKKDGLFDEQCVKKFIEFLAVYPVGTFVHLNTGDTALVIRSNHDLVTKPVVEVIVNAEGEVPLERQIIDLARNTLVHIERPLEREREREVVAVLQPRGEPEVVV